MQRNYYKLDITKEGVYTIFVRDTDGKMWEEANVLKYFMHLRYGKRNKFQSRRKYAEDLYQFFQWAILQKRTKDIYKLLLEFREMLSEKGFFYAFGDTSYNDFIIIRKACASIKSQIMSIENYYYFLADNYLEENLIRSSKMDYRDVQRKSKFGFGSGFGLKMLPTTAAYLLTKKRMLPIERCDQSTGKEDTYFPFKYFMGSSVYQDNNKEFPGLVDWIIERGDKTSNPSRKHAKYRDALLVLLMGGTSARIGQACSLTLWDINEKSKEVYLIDPESERTPHYLKTNIGRSEQLIQKYDIVPSTATKASGFKYPIPTSHAPLLWINNVVKDKFFSVYRIYKTMINFAEMPWVFQSISPSGNKSRLTPSPNGHANKMITNYLKDYREQFKLAYRNTPDDLELRQLFMANGPHSFRHMYGVTLLTYSVTSSEHNSTLLQFFIMEGMGLKSESVAYKNYLKIANSYQKEIVVSFNKISGEKPDKFIDYIKLTSAKYRGLVT